MKKMLLSCLPLLLCCHAYAETNLRKDIDGDGLPDRIWLHEVDLHIQLSSLNKTLSDESVCDESSSSLKTARVGFIMSCSAMRYGHSEHYAYNPNTQTIQIIGADYWAFGNAANQGAGKDSINFKTGDYIAKWRLRDPHTGKLRDYAMQTRLPDIQPIDILNPERDSLWQSIFDKVQQEKWQRKWPIN